MAYLKILYLNFYQFRSIAVETIWIHGSLFHCRRNQSGKCMSPFKCFQNLPHPLGLNFLFITLFIHFIRLAEKSFFTWWLKEKSFLSLSTHDTSNDPIQLKISMTVFFFLYSIFQINILRTKSDVYGNYYYQRIIGIKALICRLFQRM